MICQRSAFVFPGGRMPYYFRYSYPISKYCITHTLLLFCASWIIFHDSNHAREILIDPSNFFAMRYLYGAGKHQLLYTTQKWLSSENENTICMTFSKRQHIGTYIFLVTQVSPYILAFCWLLQFIELPCYPRLDRLLLYFIL